MTTQDVTDKDVRDAERQAGEDAARVEQLKARVMDGDADVTSDDIGQARRLAEFSDLKVTAVRQQAAAATERKRQEACAALRPEIDAFADQFANQAAGKLQAISDAVAAYWSYMDQQEAQRAELLKRTVALAADEWRAPIVPPDHDAGIGYRGHLLIAGRRRIDRIDAGHFMGRALGLAAREMKPTTLRFSLDYHGTVTVAPAERDSNAVADLTRLVQEMPGPGEAYFVRGPGGAISERDRPWTDEEVKQQKLTRISAKEAWGV